ncbi:hemolysin family protein [Pseudochelatococcus contaminans]|uniref:CBS domain containing-hemolysin-like protein n=1 Tax=Pseudochelatococcus contaminans TaxID=1538103 RepID=A0A7W5Z6F7_9HYPH|nr:hemolysin family protein [Pseudochelatococcus contaminans]MBB3811003.1 CBS domain containing-hemolysin-like protein [Pseudochelatococcus contaminans]
MSDDRSPPSKSDESGSGREGDSWIDRLLTGLGLRNDTSVREALEDALEEGSTGSDFTAQERSLLQNVLDVNGLRVVDTMVPRADIIALHEDVSLAEAIRAFRDAGHSRLPVYGESLDDPRGMVHIRDFLEFIAERGGAAFITAEGELPTRLDIDLTTPLSQAAVLRPVLYVPPSMPVMDLLVRMQATRTHMALVIDEYGGTDGLISMEDIMEMLVGNIEDEHDREEIPEITQTGPRSYVIDARADLDDVAQATGFDFDTIEVSEEVDTIGGLIVTLAGRVPEAGERIAGPFGLVFDILDADSRRLKRLRLSLGGEDSVAPLLAAEQPKHEPAAVFDLTRADRKEGKLPPATEAAGTPAAGSQTAMPPEA